MKTQRLLIALTLANLTLLVFSLVTATRPAIVRSVKLRGWTLPLSTSSHVQGAETGAPARARTV